jgi:hypothetical protein
MERHALRSFGPGLPYNLAEARLCVLKPPSSTHSPHLSLLVTVTSYHRRASRARKGRVGFSLPGAASRQAAPGPQTSPPVGSLERQEPTHFQTFVWVCKRHSRLFDAGIVSKAKIASQADKAFDTGRRRWPTLQ